VPSLHDCTSTSFVDDSAAGANRTITFGGAAGLKYSPKCMIITAGQKVTFAGDFTSHPLVGAEYQGFGGSYPTPIPSTSSGSASIDVTFPTAGLYPYYCTFHAGSGMTGVLWVQ
jgi:plastocyanin